LESTGIENWGDIPMASHEPTSITIRLLSEFGRIASSVMDIRELLGLIARLISDLFSHKALAIYLFDWQNGSILQRHLEGYEEKHRQQLDQKLAWNLFQKVKAQSHEIYQWPRGGNRRCPCLLESTEWAFLIPLGVPGEPMGFIWVESEERPGDLESTREWMSLVSIQASVALKNAFLYRQIQRESLEKSLLLDVSKRISSSLHVSEVLNLIIDSLRQVIPYDAAGIFLIHGRTGHIWAKTLRGYEADAVKRAELKVGRGLVGLVAQTGQGLVVNNVHRHRRYVQAREGTFSELVTPIRLGNRIIGVLNLESDQEGAYTERDLLLLEAFASHAAIAIENARLHEESLRRREMERELKLARQIQNALLPRGVPQLEGLDLAAISVPSETVGGDLFDWTVVRPHRLYLAIGDVSGKGMPAAILMASLYASFKGSLQTGLKINEILDRLNARMKESTPPQSFATFFCGVLDVKNGRFTYSNAGHPPPVLLRKDGQVHFLDTGGTVLGFVYPTPYLKQSLELQPGDVLVLYTDGVVEATNPKRQFFSTRRFLSVLRRHQHLEAKALLDKILQALQEFTRRKVPQDDITLLVVKVREGGQTKG